MSFVSYSISEPGKCAILQHANRTKLF